jgi:hypothetical protein
MRTYLTVMFNSGGGRPSEVVSRLHMIGFKVTYGNYDFIYEWGREDVSMEDAIEFADRVHEVLKGLNVTFKLETQIAQVEEE